MHPDDPDPAVSADANEPASAEAVRPEADEQPDPIGAAREAVTRAKLAARERGYRPGGPVRRQRRAADVGAGRRTDRDGRDPGLLGDQLDRLLVDRGWQVDVAAGAVAVRWPQIVGEQVSAHCSVLSFEEGVLTVQAESTAWRTQLEYLESTLMGQIEQAIGPGVVLTLRFVGPRAPTWRHGRFLAPGSRGPRDTYG